MKEHLRCIVAMLMTRGRLVLTASPSQLLVNRSSAGGSHVRYADGR